jgi:triosephosphate isomerase
MRRPFIAGNWKLHKTVAESLELVNTLKAELADIDDADIVVAPVFTSLGPGCRSPRRQQYNGSRSELLSREKRRLHR